MTALIRNKETRECTGLTGASQPRSASLHGTPGRVPFGSSQCHSSLMLRPRLLHANGVVSAQICSDSRHHCSSVASMDLAYGPARGLSLAQCFLFFRCCVFENKIAGCRHRHQCLHSLWAITGTQPENGLDWHTESRCCRVGSSASSSMAAIPNGDTRMHSGSISEAHVKLVPALLKEKSSKVSDGAGLCTELASK